VQLGRITKTVSLQFANGERLHIEDCVLLAVAKSEADGAFDRTGFVD